MNFVRFWLPPILWAVIIFLFSSHPTGTASNVDWQDFSIKKFAHMVEYAVLTVLVYRAFINSKVNQKRSLIVAFLFAVFYGMSDEIHQSFTPGREPTVRDVVFDTIGASVATIFVWKYLAKVPKRLRRLAEDFQLILVEEK